MKKKVLVAMSGGVDSAVAAVLLLNIGYSVTGITMCLGTSDEEGQAKCCGMNAINDALAVCNNINVSHHIIDFTKDLRESVIDRFVMEYKSGRTPNPCIDCNRYLKFGRLLKMARAMGFDYLATGHYARIVKYEEGYCLMKAKDKAKDQTYFLYPINKDDLPDILFPLGDYTKQEIREIAYKTCLPVAQKAESQDICFVNNGGYGQFLKKRRGIVKPGLIVDIRGKELGTHMGIAFYTVGQRHGIGIPAKSPLYVVAVNAPENKIIVGTKKDLMSKSLYSDSFNLLVDHIPARAEGKIRYRKTAAACSISSSGTRIRIDFDEPQESITPGQAVVLYSGERVIGGGIIDEVINGTG